MTVLAFMHCAGLQAALFLDPGSRTATNAAPTFVPGYPNARQAVGQRPPGIYEAGHLEDQLVFVRVAEDAATYADLLKQRKAGAAAATADELLAATIDPEVPNEELASVGPQMAVHGYTVYGASAQSKRACPAQCCSPCGASDSAAPRAGDQLDINVSPSDVGAFNAAATWLHHHHDPVTQANINAYFGYSTTPCCPNHFNPPRVPPSLGPDAGKSVPGANAATAAFRPTSVRFAPAPLAATRATPSTEKIETLRAQESNPEELTARQCELVRNWIQHLSKANNKTVAPPRPVTNH